MRVQRWCVGLAVLLLAPFLLVAPAGAAEPVGPAGIVTDVETYVDETSQLYHVNVEFTFAPGSFTCPSVLDYRMAGHLESGIDMCTGGTPRTSVVDQRSVLAKAGGSGAIRPEGVECDDSETPDLKGCQIEIVIRNPITNPAPGGAAARTFLEAPNTPKQLWIPPRPIWIGVGDGYTSVRLQEEDACFDYVDPDSRAACGIDDSEGAPVEPDHEDYSGFRSEANWPDSSWIYRAVSALNSNLNANNWQVACSLGQSDVELSDSCWQVYPIVVARDTVTAASLGSPATDVTNQVGQMRDALARHEGSWNWVGLSAGLLDSGIPEAIDQVYRDFGVLDENGAYTYNGDAPFPWRAIDPAECPQLEGVAQTVADTAPAIEAGIERVIAEAASVSRGVRVIVTQYPFLTEVIGTSGHNDYEAPGEQNLCAVEDPADADATPENREGVLALNGVLRDIIADTPNAAGGQAQVFPLDLQEAFTDEPTDTHTAPDSPTSHESYLALARPYGYPYPSGKGGVITGAAAVKSATTSGLRSPAMDAEVVHIDPDTGVVTPREANAAGWYRDTDLYVRFVVTPGSGTLPADLPEPQPLVPGRSVSYSASIVDSNGKTASASRQVSFDPDAPVVTPTYYDTATGLPVTLRPGQVWIDRPVTIKWVVQDPTVSADGVTTYTPSGAPYQEFNNPDGGTEMQDLVVPDVEVDVEDLGPFTATVWDEAGNPAVGLSPIQIDPVDPTVVGVPSTTAWTNDDVTVTWTLRDTGGSTLADYDDVEGQAFVATTTESAEGEYDATAPGVLDEAGNVGIAAPVRIRIDKTAPTGGITGLAQDTYSLTEINALLDSVSCAGEDTLSGFASCTVPAISTSTSGGITTWTFSSTVRDVAGNSSVVSKVITISYVCSDGLDNDGDGFVDFPADPGCDDATDGDETDVVHVCSDGLDNDGDGLADFPADPGCDDATDDDETNEAECMPGTVVLRKDQLSDADDDDDDDDPLGDGPWRKASSSKQGGSNKGASNQQSDGGSQSNGGQSDGGSADGSDDCSIPDPSDGSFDPDDTNAGSNGSNGFNRSNGSNRSNRSNRSNGSNGSNRSNSSNGGSQGSQHDARDDSRHGSQDSRNNSNGSRDDHSNAAKDKGGKKK